MRRLRELNEYRRPALERKLAGKTAAEMDSRDVFGLFVMPSDTPGLALRVIAAAGDGWDHLSVSTELRCPTWAEMDRVKRAFFQPDEVAFQLHVATANHISRHPFCLHIWRPHGVDIPLPPADMV